LYYRRRSKIDSDR